MEAQRQVPDRDWAKEDAGYREGLPVRGGMVRR
jgi:hypothetical protein